MARECKVRAYSVKQETLGPAILRSKNNLKVFCYPSPQDSEIAVLMKGLSVDIGEKQGVEKRKALEAMKTEFQQNLGQIYNETLEAKKWVGCDIWDFFSSKKVDNLCIRPNSRNVIIILTDGYLDFNGHNFQEGSTYSYISDQDGAKGPLIDRRNGELKDKGLEILLLEMNPKKIAHRDKMKETLENWFKSMGIEKVVISETDADMVNTQTIIKIFLDNKEQGL